MGDRALIQLKDREENVSPVLYLHWSGHRVGQIIELTESRMAGRPNDIQYAFARLVQQAVLDDDHNTGFGVWNHDKPLTEEDSHGDAGCFLVDISAPKWVIQCFGGYGLGEDA